MNFIRVGIIYFCLAYVGSTYAQTFELKQPDTTKLKLAQNVLNYNESLGYLYLKEYYNVNSSKDSIELYEWDSEGGICSFQQDFEFGLHYKMWKCREAGGILETITFPKIESNVLKQFIEFLFFNESNVWIDENRYEPDGVGCYYEIIQNEMNSQIEIYCGC